MGDIVYCSCTKKPDGPNSIQVVKLLQCRITVTDVRPPERVTDTLKPVTIHGFEVWF